VQYKNQKKYIIVNLALKRKLNTIPIGITK